MNLPVYDAFEDPYTYPNSTVLRNLFGVRDQATLDMYEVAMTSMRAEESLPVGRFDAAHFRAVHRHLFRDVYEWAGDYRTVRIAKNNSAFCYPEYIASEMDRIFHALPSVTQLRVLDRGSFLQIITHLLADLNAVHPFREGNGRTQLVFLAEFALESGRTLRFYDLNKEALLNATVASF